jgi:hypothetical protein
MQWCLDCGKRCYPHFLSRWDNLVGAQWHQQTGMPLAALQHVFTALLQDNGQTVVETVSQVCSRGLRLKVGIDMGRLMDSVHPATGRMAYRGRAMNRAARISATATSGQVTYTPTPGKCLRTKQPSFPSSK